MKVDIDYNTVWSTMNSLEEQTSDLVYIRTVVNAIKEYYNDSTRVYSLSTAAVELIDLYLDSWDSKFQTAWNETVSKIKTQENDAFMGPQDLMRRDGWEFDGEGGWYKISDC